MVSWVHNHRKDLTKSTILYTNGLSLNDISLKCLQLVYICKILFMNVCVVCLINTVIMFASNFWNLNLLKIYVKKWHFFRLL